MNVSKAYDELKDQGITVRVIDLYSVKPIDVKTLQTAARETETLVVVEDHWAEGGLGDAVLDAFAVKGPPARGGKMPLVDVLPKVVKMAVRSMPRFRESRKELDWNMAGIAAGSIVTTVKALLK